MKRVQILPIPIGLIAILLIIDTAYIYPQCPPDLVFSSEIVADGFGYKVSGVGDVNNDGFDDLIIGAYSNDSGGTDAGRAYVYSGQSGNLLFTFTGEAAGDAFGVSVSGAGDVNNDGFDDLIVGAPLNAFAGLDAGRAYVYSGQDGSLLYTFTGEAAEDYLGSSVSSCGDVNNDGFDDFLIGSSRWENGRAYVYSGQSGTLIYTLISQESEDLFGRNVAGAGDVNNDGIDDFIIGANLDSNGGFRAGRAYIYSGLNGNLLYTFTGEAAGDQFGFSVSEAGDVNNDSFDDLIVAAIFNDASGTNSGRVYVYSGIDGQLLHIFTGYARGDLLGWSVSGAGDMNKDGFDDIIVGAPGQDAFGHRTGQAYVYSGQSGDLLYTYTGEEAEDAFGVSVSNGGDMNDDGINDLIVGAHTRSRGGSQPGWVYVFYGREWLCGDANGDSLVTFDDVNYLIDFYFHSGSVPFSFISSDLNCDGSVDITDILFLARYLNGGEEPCCL